MKGRKPDLQLKRKYLELLTPHFGKSSREIAEATGLGAKHIQKLLKKYDLPRLPNHSPFGSRNPSWKGGRIIDKSGYILILSPTHPYKNWGGYVREHRLIVEKMLGRFLNPKEVVHHKNGIRSDNMIENLEVFGSNGEHLKIELTGKTPKWSAAGKQKILTAVRQKVRKRKRDRGKFVPDV